MSFKQAVDFTNKIKEYGRILSVVLFGSLARGEATTESYVDLAIIYTKKDENVIKKINSMAPDRFQLLHLTLEGLKDQPTIVGALSGEGIILYGIPINITIEDMDLKSKVIIAYDTSKLNQNERNKLNRALFGGISTYLKGEERKTKQYHGILDEIPSKRIGKGVLLIDRRNTTKITKTLQRFKARWKEIPVWTY